jgi:O-acetyl-ADP-ribose deacetylase (regulator of RNase III)
MCEIRLIHGSCADEEVDAVVNAANRYLAEGGGICGVIFRKAGSRELKRACDEYAVPLKDGDAVITPAFGIKNARFIIHAVGPDFSITPDAFDKLFDAYYNSLKVLRDNGLHSISFPLISSGIFGGRLENPAAVSAREAVRAYNAFTQKYADYALDVRLCAFSDGEYSSALSAFDV